MASQHDIGPAEATYKGFIGLVKWGSVGVAIVTVLVVLLIAPK